MYKGGLDPREQLVMDVYTKRDFNLAMTRDTCGMATCAIEKLVNANGNPKLKRKMRRELAWRKPYWC